MKIYKKKKKNYFLIRRGWKEKKLKYLFCHLMTASQNNGAAGAGVR